MNKDKEIEHLKNLVDRLSRNYVTGLHGRYMFMNKLREIFEKDEFWLIAFDVDNLHVVNRVDGWEAGDALLVEVANDICLMKEICCSFHIGGDEFYAIAEEPPVDIAIPDTTSVFMSSKSSGSVDQLLRAIDKKMREEKKILKKRRRNDI
jgi:GGDEF domain-containing protein